MAKKFKREVVPLYDKVFINVPYDDKEEAKSLGARWDSKRKRWYYKKGQEGYQNLYMKWG